MAKAETENQALDVEALTNKLSGYLADYRKEPVASDYFIPLTEGEVEDIIAGLKRAAELEKLVGEHAYAEWLVLNRERDAALERATRLEAEIQRTDKYKGYIVEGSIIGPDPNAQPHTYLIPAVYWGDIVAALAPAPAEEGE